MNNKKNQRSNQNNSSNRNNSGANRNKMPNIPDNKPSSNVLTNKNSGWCMPTIIYVVLFSITLVMNLFQDPYNNEHKNIAFKINLISHHLLYGLIFTIIIYIYTSICRF